VGENEAQQFMKFFGRHFVAICLKFRLRDDDGPDRFFAASGTYIKIGDIHGILTAGHVVTHLQQSIADERVVKTECYLVDTFGPIKISDMGVPYDLRDSPYLEYEVRGLDFGVLFLNDNQVRLIEKHQIIPITYQASLNEPGDLDRYWIMGLPAELTSERVTDIGEGTVGFGMVPVKRLPSEAPENGDWPRFKGEIVGDLAVESIEGMSGGPIFGMCTERPEKYWIVAIQSSWLKSTRTVFGCPTPWIVGILQKLHDEAAAELAGPKALQSAPGEEP